MRRRTAKALVRSGVLRPVRPDRLARMVAAARLLGTSPATSVALGAARHPDRPAVIDEEGIVSFAQLDQAGAELAGALRASHGIGPDAPVAIMCRNHRGFVEALLAGGRLGADVLLLNTDFPGPQLRQALGRTELGAVVLDAEFSTRFDEAGYSGPRIVERPRGGEPFRGRPGRSSRIVILSSGTTGAPKGAGRAPSLRALVGPLVTLLEQLRPRAGAPILIGPPLFHGFGLAFLGFAQLLGSPVVLRRRFDPEQALADVERHAVETLIAVPVMLQRMLAAGDAHSLSSLRAVASAGAPLPPHVALALLDAWGDVLFNLYGSTETGFAAIAGPADLRAAPGCVGRAPLGTTLELLDADRCPADAGHIFVGGDLVFDGYTGGGSKETIGALMNTGDIGHRDAAGRLFVDGREDDMIVSGGENVFPGEVEEVLATHAGVDDVAVIGVTDHEFGQRLKAFAVVRDGVTPDDLIAHVKANLARYKVPREIVFVAEIPRNPTGKVLKRELG